MSYEEERPGYELEEGDNEVVEDAGVLHFVHAWIQQCQKAKVRHSLSIFLLSSDE